MNAFYWILLSGLGMCAVAATGGLTLLMSEEKLRTILLPLVAFAAGTLLGGAFFHLIPAAAAGENNGIMVYLCVAAGFSSFLALEQFLSWHQSHQPSRRGQPITYLILTADSVHNFIDGLAVAGAFLVDFRLGVGAWIAAAAHEIPQELGDFAVLVHGGWKPARALFLNVLSASTFLVGGLAAYASSSAINMSLLLPFAAGNFIYIAAADLIPDVKAEFSFPHSIIHFGAFSAGLLLLLLVRIFFE